MNDKEIIMTTHSKKQGVRYSIYHDNTNKKYSCHIKNQYNKTLKI